METEVGVEVFKGVRSSLRYDNAEGMTRQYTYIASGSRDASIQPLVLCVPQQPLVLALVLALFHGGSQARWLCQGWREDAHGRFTYQGAIHREGAIPVQVGIAPQSPRASWHWIEGLSPLTVDVALVVLCLLSDPITWNNTAHRSISVRAICDTILQCKNLPVFGRKRRAWEERIELELTQLLELRFTLDSGTISGQAALSQPFFRRLHQSDAPTRTSGYHSFWLSDIDAYELCRGEQNRWCQFPIRLLQLDHRENRGPEMLAKKLGIYLYLYAALNAAPVQLWSISALLIAVGELPEPRNKNWAGRSRDRFDEALLRLSEWGLVSKVAWPDGAGPGDANRSKGWVEYWLEARVQIELPVHC